MIIINSKPLKPTKPFEIGDKVKVRIPVYAGSNLYLYGEITELGGQLVEVRCPDGREITSHRSLVSHYEED